MCPTEQLPFIHKLEVKSHFWLGQRVQPGLLHTAATPASSQDLLFLFLQQSPGGARSLHSHGMENLRGMGNLSQKPKSCFWLGPPALRTWRPLELPLSSWAQRGRLFPTVHPHRPHLPNTTCSKTWLMETHFQSKPLGEISNFPKQLEVSIPPQ